MPITVTVLDTGGIQPFIFGSNVLRENIGASELVHRATRLWAFEALRDLEQNHNVDVTAAREDRIRDMYTGKFQADDTEQTGAEVLYAGGGNTVVLFQGKGHATRARDFVYRLSGRILREAPGLNLYAAHQEYTWGDPEKSLPGAIGEAMKELGKLKGRDSGALPALGFPITAACTSTGLPANGRHPDKGKAGAANRANRQVEAKWKAADRANDRLRGIFPWIEEALFEWTDNFDDLADLRERDDGYVAVVHVDGNGMGRRIKDLTDKWSNRPKEPRGYIEAMREMSTRVQETAQKALKETLQALTKRLAVDDWSDPRQHAFKDGVHYFPIRPLVFGGDDVTLVCAGPWGLAVAARYLVELEAQMMPDGQGGESPPYACAGVAIVKTHYPFSQAYGLSEELLKEAKRQSKELADKKASALDWHFTTTGLAGRLGEIRAREYTTSKGPLQMRPIMLLPDYGWRNWDTLTRLMERFGEGGDWQVRRNKTIRLREALRGGPVRVAEFWTIFGEKGQVLPKVLLGTDERLDNGWVESPEKDKDGKVGPMWRSLYFDAIEIAEQFFDLPGEEESA